MRIYDIILKKRNGGTLTGEEIAFFIDGYVNGSIPDYQASALCMAIFFRGMTDDETAALTDCMARSGDRIDLSRFGDLTVDKHSTGGVGDKTTLIVAPIVASLGGKVAKMSGRGLGHTGGTVDKLESIPGMRVTMDREVFLRQVEQIGIAVIGQSGNLTPADKKLYALRDVTATVDSIPLITSSVMSKKIAAGSKSIVLDVKAGSGAFMKTPDDARTLARNMVAIGKACGRRMAALITDMSRPLGATVGNTLEVVEAVKVLRGASKGDLYDVCVALASEMTMLFAGVSRAEAESQVVGAIESGAAFKKMQEWVSAQGGDSAWLADVQYGDGADLAVPVLAPADGYLTNMDAEAIGGAAVLLGAGRSKKEDDIDHSAGILVSKKTGDAVKKGQVLATLYTNDAAAVEPATKRYLGALTVGSEPPATTGLIFDIIR